MPSGLQECYQTLEPLAFTMLATRRIAGLRQANFRWSPASKSPGTGRRGDRSTDKRTPVFEPNAQLLLDV